MIINFELLQSKQNDQFKNLCISCHGEARNIKFGQLVNLFQLAYIGYSTWVGSDAITS